MRPWLYDTLSTAIALRGFVYGNPTAQVPVFPRESLDSTKVGRPFIAYGLGNSTNEDLSEDLDYETYRQFFQVWIHDEGGDYSKIEAIMNVIRQLLPRAGNAPAYGLMVVKWLEDSQEFSDQTFGTLFRYMRFQAIIAKDYT